jgi:molecular chaperone GrpE
MDDSLRSSLGHRVRTRNIGTRSGRRVFCLGWACVLLSLAAPATAGAATIDVKPATPPEPRVGATWNVDITVHRDGGDVAGAPAVITLLNETTGDQLNVATKQAKQDVYHASFAFPTEGSWRYRVSSGNAGVVSAKAIAVEPAKSSPWKLAALVAAGSALGALVALLLARRRQPGASSRAVSEPQRPEPPPTPRAAARPAPLDDAQMDRQSLIRSCVYLYDIVREPTLRDRLRVALADAGVTELDSVGGRFDPGKHKATGRVPTGDPSLDGQVAEVERPGFLDRGRVLRLPEVTVYSVSDRESRG